MNLNPFSLFKKNSKGYIGLLLRETDGIIMYLEADEDYKFLHKLDSEKFTLTSRWDHLSDDVDNALYKLEVRTKKTFDDIIFFVYSHFVEPETHELKRQNLTSIKSLVKSMELKPLGFIEVHEAYLKYLLTKDKQPFSGLIVESDNTMLSVFTYQAGKLISQVSAGRKKGFLSDLVETLASLKESVVLPSRIVLLPSKDMSEGADLVEHTWDEKLFNHQPSITIVQEEEIVNCLIHTFSTQITDLPAMAPNKKTADTPDLHESEERDLDEELALDGQEEQTTVPEVTMPAEVSTERMGFVIGGETEGDSEVIDRSEILKPTVTSSLMRLWIHAMSKVKMLIARLRTMTLFRSRTLFLHSSIIVGVVLILIGAVLMELNLHKATITMTLPSQKLELSRSFDATNFGLKEGSDSAEFDAQTSATGVKNVGEPAKGGVTVYNSSLSSGKTFAKGTTLIGPNSLSFTLDSDVKLASASGDAIDIVSSSAKSNVTAAAIGPESNLAAGTKFSVGDEPSSSVIAKNDGSFSGGTKRQIQVVSDKDIAKAESQIDAKAQDYLKTKVGKSLGADAVLLKPLTNVEITSQDVNNDVGTEANSVSLKAKVRIGYSYLSDKKLKEEIRKVLASKVQKGLAITDKNLKYSITNVTQKNGDISVSVKVTAHAVPPTTETEIVKSIAGKTTGGLQTLAKERYHAESVDFTIEHPIGFLKNLLPLFSNNIKLRLLYP